MIEEDSFIILIRDIKTEILITRDIEFLESEEFLTCLYCVITTSLQANTYDLNVLKEIQILLEVFCAKIQNQEYIEQILNILNIFKEYFNKISFKYMENAKQTPQYLLSHELYNPIFIALFAKEES